MIELASAEECIKTPAGTYVSMPGLTAPEGLCAAGHYCYLGASEQQPHDSEDGGGHCAAGHVCTGGTKTPNPDGSDDTGYPCPRGNFCPEGSEHEQGCVPGTYQPSEGQGECLTCPASSRCPGNSTEPEPCPLGRYCEAGSGNGVLCPAGSYGHQINLAAADDCAACPEKMYCIDGNITGPVEAGYFARGSAPSATPDVEVSQSAKMIYDASVWSPLSFGQCPPGHFCPRASATERGSNVTFFQTPGRKCSPEADRAAAPRVPRG